MKLNADWHRGHKMPKNPSLDQRVSWHLEHARHCGCRDVPSTIKAELRKRGLAVPRRK